MDTKNTQLIKDAYAAFQRGDIAAILGMCTDDIDWHGVIGTEGVLPQAGHRHGKAEVRAFFEAVAASTDFKRFEPREFIDGGSQVAVVGHYEATLKPSGHAYASEWVMIFDIRDGKVSRFREFSDSAQMVRAYRGERAGS